MIQTIGGLVALIASGWLLWDVSVDFMGVGGLMVDPEFTETKNGRVVIGVFAFRYLAKLFGGWVLAILAGVLLS